MTNSFDLSQEIVAITGAAGIIGSELVESLLTSGARVSFSDLDDQRLNILADRLTRFEGRFFASKCDLESPSEIARWIETTEKKFGPLTTLINNAQGKPPGFYDSFENYKKDALMRTLDINLIAPIICSQIAIKSFRKSGRGNIINIASIYGLVAPDQRIYEGVKNPYYEGPFSSPVSYAVSKAGLVQLTKYLASYLRGENIRVNCLTPGGVQDDHQESFVRNYANRTLLNRMANRTDYGGAIVFLCSPASQYMTGANLVVDGGWTAI